MPSYNIRDSGINMLPTEICTYQCLNSTLQAIDLSLSSFERNYYELTCFTKFSLVVDGALTEVSSCTNVQTAHTAILTNGWRTRPVQSGLFSCR